jgi:hypothetical protein
MKKNYLLCFGIVVIVALLAIPTLSAATINVPADFGTIQAAINAASPGDTIKVAPGIYFEKVVINKSGITLLDAKAGIDPRGGARIEGDPTETIIDGDSTLTEGIYIQGSTDAIRVTDIVIDGFEVRRPTYACVRFDYASNVILRNTMAHHCTTNEGIKTKAGYR